MCLSVEVRKLDGSIIDCSTANELAACLGCAVTDLISRTGTVLTGNECLCDLNDEQTAESCGYVASFDPTYFDVVMTQAVMQ